MESFLAQLVCQSIGNSQAVAQRRYRQVTDEQFKRERRCSAPQNVLQGTSKSVRTDTNDDGDNSAEPPENTGDSGTIQETSDPAKKGGMGDIGLEPTTSSV